MWELPQAKTQHEVQSRTRNAHDGKSNATRAISCLLTRSESLCKDTRGVRVGGKIRKRIAQDTGVYLVVPTVECIKNFSDKAHEFEASHTR